MILQSNIRITVWSLSSVVLMPWSRESVSCPFITLWQKDPSGLLFLSWFYVHKDFFPFEGLSFGFFDLNNLIGNVCSFFISFDQRFFNLVSLSEKAIAFFHIGYTFFCWLLQNIYSWWFFSYINLLSTTVTLKLSFYNKSKGVFL